MTPNLEHLAMLLGTDDAGSALAGMAVAEIERLRAEIERLRAECDFEVSSALWQYRAMTESNMVLVTLPPASMAWLQMESERRGLSLSAIIREIIVLELPDRQRKSGSHESEL